MIAGFRAVYPRWWRRLAFLAVLFGAVYLLLVAVVVDPIAGPEIEKRPFIAANQAVSYVAALGGQGRLIYAIQQGIDVLFVATYTTVLSFAGVSAGRWHARWMTAVVLAAIALAALVDLIEDALLIVLLWPVDGFVEAGSAAVGAVVAVKLASFAAALVGTVVVGVLAIGKARSRMGSSGS